MIALVEQRWARRWSSGERRISKRSYRSKQVDLTLSFPDLWRAAGRPYSKASTYLVCLW